VEEATEKRSSVCKNMLFISFAPFKSIHVGVREEHSASLPQKTDTSTDKTQTTQLNLLTREVDVVVCQLAYFD